MLNDTKYKEKILKEYGFIDIETAQYETHKSFSSEDYIRLIDTYSDHHVIPVEDKQIFYAKIKDLINSHGGIIHINYVNILVIGRK